STPPGRRSGRRTPPGWPRSARCRRSRSCSPTGRRARSGRASAWRSWSSRNSPGRAARPATERIAPMGIRRSDHVVVRPDGTLERVASVEPSSEEQAENERFGDRFDELLQQDEPGAPAEERDPRSSLLLTPTRPPWRDPAAKAATPPEPATVGRERDAQQPKESSKSDRAGDAPADPSADAPDASGARAALHAKHGKSGEREGGHDSGGGQGDKDGAMMALQGDPARPQPAPGAPAGASAPPSSGAGLIAEVAGEVASRIATTSGHGASQVRIDLRDEVLPQTSMTVENQAG